MSLDACGCGEFGVFPGVAENVIIEAENHMVFHRVMIDSFTLAEQEQPCLTEEKLDVATTTALVHRKGHQVRAPFQQLYGVLLDQFLRI